MAMVNIELFETDYQRLVQVASQFGKTGAGISA